jgi:hypothetical protein
MPQQPAFLAPVVLYGDFVSYASDEGSGRYAITDRKGRERARRVTVREVRGVVDAEEPSSRAGEAPEDLYRLGYYMRRDYDAAAALKESEAGRGAVFIYHVQMVRGGRRFGASQMPRVAWAADLQSLMSCVVGPILRAAELRDRRAHV